MAITVRPIEPAEHRRFLATLPRASWLHSPEWFASKPPGRAEALGIEDDGDLVGVAVLQYRRPSPRLPLREAYLPHGPVVHWQRTDPLAVYDALAEHAARRGAIRIRVEPAVDWRQWDNATVKEVLGQDFVGTFDDVTPDLVHAEGARVADALAQAPRWFRPQWRDFGDAQPSCNFIVPLAGRDVSDILAGMNQMYRRNIKKAEKAGVVALEGGPELLPTFHRLHAASAAREQYRGMSLEYLQHHFAAFGNDPDHVRVVIVELDGEPLAGGIWMRYGDKVWYTHGGSVEAHREVRAVNALQWAMLQTSKSVDAVEYDMGGVYPVLNDATRGLLQFKVGTGGHLVQYPHERMRVLNPAGHRLVELVGAAGHHGRRLVGRGRQVVGSARRRLGR